MDYMYIDVTGIPMKADRDTMKLLAVLEPSGDGSSVVERAPTAEDDAIWVRNLFWSGSEIGRGTAERLAYDRNLVY